MFAPLKSLRANPVLWERIALFIVLAAYFAGLLFINFFYAPYPYDNDLPYVGWLTANLSFSRLESLGNQNYPLGFPVLLFFLKPVFGTFVKAVFFWQTVMGTALIGLIYLIARTVTKSAIAAFAALLCAVFLTFSMVTSEFADLTAACLLLTGLYFLLKSPEKPWSYLVLGLSIGLAWLFRFHYLIVFFLIGPAAVLILGGEIRKGKALLYYTLGFIAGALPLLIVNILNHKFPLYTGFSPYMVGIQTEGIDWNDFLSTYNLWPLGRLIKEKSGDLIGHIFNNAVGLIQRREVWLAAALFCFAMIFPKDKKSRKVSIFFGAAAALYCGFVILPTGFTDRSFLPVAALISIFIAGQLSFRASQIPNRILAGIAGVLVFPLIIFIFYQHQEGMIFGKHEGLVYNNKVIDILKQNGMKKSYDVFCTDWYLYNFSDPDFITFHNYGGWLLLDSKFASENPPPRMQTLEEWLGYFDYQRINFLIANQDGPIAALFKEEKLKGWETIFEDQYYLIKKRK